MSNRLITLIQIDSDRAQWAEFISKIEKLGYKSKEDFFPSTVGEPSAGFKSEVANADKVKALRTKYKISSFGLESKEVNTLSKQSLTTITEGTKVKLRENNLVGEVLSEEKGEYGYSIKLENGAVVKRDSHEFNILRESTNGAFEGSGLVVTARDPKDQAILAQFAEEGDFYAEFNDVENYWFFPEEPEHLDNLEGLLSKEFNDLGISVTFEAQDAPVENDLDEKLSAYMEDGDEDAETKASGFDSEEVADMKPEDSVKQKMNLKDINLNEVVSPCCNAPILGGNCEECGEPIPGEEPTQSENIDVPINKGDTVLGGKFKNRKITVNDISKDDKDQITINNKPLLKVRTTDQVNESNLDEDKIIPKKFGIAVFTRDWKEDFSEIQKSVNSIQKKYAGFHFLDDLSTGEDDNIYTLVTNHPEIEKIFNEVGENLLNLDHFSDKDDIVWFNNLKDLSSLANQGKTIRDTESNQSEKDSEDLEKAGTKGQAVRKKLEKGFSVEKFLGMGWEKQQKFAKQKGLPERSAWSYHDLITALTLKVLGLREGHSIQSPSDQTTGWSVAEGEGNSGLESYKKEVEKELDRLESGDKVKEQLDSKYVDMIKNNFDKGIAAQLTGQYIRDHWYGVNEGQEENTEEIPSHIVIKKGKNNWYTIINTHNNRYYQYQTSVIGSEAEKLDNVKGVVKQFGKDKDENWNEKNSFLLKEIDLNQYEEAEVSTDLERNEISEESTKREPKVGDKVRISTSRTSGTKSYDIKITKIVNKNLVQGEILKGNNIGQTVKGKIEVHLDEKRDYPKLIQKLYRRQGRNSDGSSKIQEGEENFEITLAQEMFKDLSQEAYAPVTDLARTVLQKMLHDGLIEYDTEVDHDDEGRTTGSEDYYWFTDKGRTEITSPEELKDQYFDLDSDNRSNDSEAPYLRGQELGEAEFEEGIESDKFLGDTVTLKADPFKKGTIMSNDSEGVGINWLDGTQGYEHLSKLNVIKDENLEEHHLEGNRMAQEDFILQNQHNPKAGLDQIYSKEEFEVYGDDEIAVIYHELEKNLGMIDETETSEIGTKGDVELADILPIKPYEMILPAIAKEEGTASDLYQAVENNFMGNKVNVKNLINTLKEFDVYEKYKHLLNFNEGEDALVYAPDEDKYYDVKNETGELNENGLGFDTIANDTYERFKMSVNWEEHAEEYLKSLDLSPNQINDVINILHGEEYFDDSVVNLGEAKKIIKKYHGIDIDIELAKVLKEEIEIPTTSRTEFYSEALDWYKHFKKPVPKGQLLEAWYNNFLKTGKKEFKESK